MLKSLLVPKAVLVEDELLTSRSISPDKVRIEHVAFPHERSVDLVCINLFQVANVDVVALNLAKERRFAEDYLLSVREQLRVPREVLHRADLTRHLHGHQEERHNKEGVQPSEEGSQETKRRVVSQLTKEHVGSVWRLVEVDGILVRKDVAEASVIVNGTALTKG